MSFYFQAIYILLQFVAELADRDMTCTLFFLYQFDWYRHLCKSRYKLEIRCASHLQQAWNGSWLQLATTNFCFSCLHGNSKGLVICHISIRIQKVHFWSCRFRLQFAAVWPQVNWSICSCVMFDLQDPIRIGARWMSWNKDPNQQMPASSLNRVEKWGRLFWENIKERGHYK